MVAGRINLKIRLGDPRLGMGINLGVQSLISGRLLKY